MCNSLKNRVYATLVVYVALNVYSRWQQALCRHPFLSNVANYLHPILKKYCLMMKELSLPVGSLTS